MGRNRVSDDANHVNDPPIATKISKELPFKLWPMPKFTPLRIKSDLRHDLDVLSQHVSRTSYDIFSLFFTFEIFQHLIDCTNQYETSLHVDIENKPYARIWFSITVEKLRAYIATWLYMSLHPESCIENFWNKNQTKAIHSSVSKHISLKRWQQINRFFHLTSLNTVHQDVFQKIDRLSEHLRVSFKLYWSIDTHLIVDKCIQRFMSRSDVIVHISSKPEPEDYKIWILANGDYVLNWLYHVKDDKKDSVNLNSVYTKKWEFSKTQAVCFDLLQQKNISDDYRCVLWVNNLFTSVDWIIQCKTIDFGIADTVRTFKTVRKKVEAKTDIEAQKKRSESNRDLNSSLSDLKLKHEAQIEWNIMYEKIINDANGLQFAWKNQQIVLFMTSVDTRRQYVQRKRRKSTKTTTNAKISRVVFGNEPIKTLFISRSIDFYNHYMNEVNVTNQLRCYYNTQRNHKKIWFSLWHWLLNVTIINNYKIVNTIEKRSYADQRNSETYKAFFNDLIIDFFEHSERLNAFRSSKSDIKSSDLVDLVNKASIWEHDNIQKLDNDSKYCVICIQIECKDVRRKRVMKSLQELSNNSLMRKQRRRRDSKTFFGCRLCDIRLCNNDYCFNEHLNVIR